MKKLLSLLGSMAITGVTVGTVIACSNLIAPTEAPENLDKLLEEISIKVNNEMQYWFKENTELFLSNEKDLELLRKKYDEAEKGGGFPAPIEYTDVPDTFNQFINSAKEKFTEVGKELILSAQFSHLFTGLEDHEVIENLDWEDLVLNDFDIVEKVNENSEAPGYKDMAAKAETIANTFQISGTFKVNFNFVVGDQKSLYTTPSNFFNTYLTKDIDILYEIFTWLKLEIPNIEEMLNSHVLTYKGYDAVNHFNRVEELYQDGGDILKILEKDPSFDPAKLDIKFLEYNNKDWYGIGTATTYNDVTLEKRDTPEADWRQNPFNWTISGSVVPFLAGFNGMASEKEVWGSSSVNFSHLLEKKEDFIETILYGSLDDIPEALDPIFSSDMTGILSFDKQYSQTFLGKDLSRDGKTITYKTKLDEHYLSPLKEFMNDIDKYSFSGNVPKEDIDVQENIVIPEEGVLTQTNVSSFGYVNFVQYFYDGLPLNLVENVPLIAVPTNNKSLEALYRDILDYAYDLFLEEIDENGKATSLLNNMWAPANNSYESESYSFSPLGDRRDGTNIFILDPEDFEKFINDKNKRTNFVEIIDHVIREQHEKIYNARPLEIDLSTSVDSKLPPINEANGLVTSTKLVDKDESYEIWVETLEDLEEKNKSWSTQLTNISNNIILDINGLKFAINNYNLWKPNFMDLQGIPRWNLGTSTLAAMKATDSIPKKYSGTIWS